jgi:metallo-beta-lactamase family protein
LDAAYDLTPDGALLVDAGASPRLPGDKVARLDWHNDASKLFLDINDALAAEADEGRRNILIRRLRRAIEGEPPHDRHA